MSFLHKPWIVVGLMVLVAVFVRVRLRDIPLERDEGEYAYAGQLILQGIPPYKEACNMKLPGSYAAYAVIMAIFGQTPGGIHTGVALVNAASIVLMYLIGRRFLDETTGVVGAVSFGLLSLSPSVLGLAGHATHFVTLFALAGTWALVRYIQRPPSSIERPASNFQLSTFNLQLALSGLLFGFSFLMKQHGVFFGIFGGIYLLASQWRIIQSPKSKVQSHGRRRSRGHVSGSSIIQAVSSVLLFTLAFTAPYALTCLILKAAGVFPQFWFWTVSYASKYASAVPAIYGADVLKTALNVVIGPHLVFWVLALAGVIWMWWDERLEDGKSEMEDWRRNKNFTGERAENRSKGSVSSVSCCENLPLRRLFLVAFLLCSFASVSVGLHYRNHYFITLLPALALLGGVAVSRALHLLVGKVRTLEIFVALALAATFGIGIIVSLTFDAPVWFGLSSEKAELQIYHTTEQRQAARLAEYIRAHTSSTNRVAVVGSEPQVYFLAHRLSATRYIYMYPLMEDQPYALKMQQETIADIEAAKPQYVIYANDELSWLPQPNCPLKIPDWWKNYWSENLELIETAAIKEGSETPLQAKNLDGTDKCLLLLKRKEIANLR